jgi:DNA/RNA-binding domain of Phe-tRNA-synthetase-like protein
VAPSPFFHVAAECQRLGLRSEAIILRNVRVAESSAELRAEIAREIDCVRARYADVEAIRATAEVAAFRALLRGMGINLKKTQPSVERLLAYALKRGALPSINNLVDAYNLTSIRSLGSLGAHDLDCIALPVSLRVLSGRESFTPLGVAKSVPVKAGEFGYVDADDRVLCWLDVLQADFSKVTSATINAFLIVEGTTAQAPQLLEQTVTDAVTLITRHCGGAAELVSICQCSSR